MLSLIAPGPALNSELDLMFGPPRPPGETRRGESKSKPKSLMMLDDQAAAFLDSVISGSRSGVPLSETILRHTYFLWIVDLDGQIFVALEEAHELDPLTGMVRMVHPLLKGVQVDDRDTVLGHPALVDAMPARIAGEIYYDHGIDRWYISNKSGRYGMGPDRKESNLKAVADLFNKLLSRPLDQFFIE